MKILKIDHLGIAVKSIEGGKNFWTDALGLKFEGTETVAEQKVTTAFLPVGESEVELLESTAPDGPIAKYLEKKAKGFNTSPSAWRTSKKPYPSSRPKGSS
jgi:methylmalonyl-CoA/ethylmalonyl-CoA epimerase